MERCPCYRDLTCKKDQRKGGSRCPFYRSVRLDRAYSHDVTAAILVYQNDETAAMLVCLDNPVGIELFSYVKTFFCSYKLA